MQRKKSMSKTSCSSDAKPVGGVVGGVTVKEAAFTLKVSPQAVYNWCACGKIDHFRVIGTIRIPKETINILKRNSTF